MAWDVQLELTDYEQIWDLAIRAQLLIRTRHEAREKYWEVHDREAYACPDCGSDGPLEVHHLDGNPFNNDMENLLALCYTCHRDRHRRWRVEQRLDAMRAEVENLGD